MAQGIPPNIQVGGITGSIPQGYILGRSSPGIGPVQLLKLSDLTAQSGAGKVPPAGGGGGSGGGVSKFTQLSDVPASYTGQSLKIVRVNAGETALEFVTLTQPTGANPSATAGAAAVNGTATTFMRSDAAPAVALGTGSAPGIVQADGTTTAITAGVMSVIAGGIAGTPADYATDRWLFGDGSDGNLTISSGTTRLSRDTCYNNVTLTGTAVLDTSGWILRIAGTLDISAAGVGAVTCLGAASSSKNGSAAVGSSAGFLGNTPSANSSMGGTIINSLGGGGGSAGATAAATEATACGNSSTYGVGGVSGEGGAGGLGASGAGGLSRPATTITTTNSGQRLTLTDFPGAVYGVVSGQGLTFVPAGMPAPGGSGGGGDGTAAGGGGGGGQAGAGLAVFARTINRSGATPAYCIHSNGGDGGAGAAATAGNRGGGGGGAGGGGGWLYLVVRFLTGTTATANTAGVKGGKGAAGGNGFGTGIGGNGGGAGQGGRLQFFNLSAQSYTLLLSSATTAHAGGAASGVTGGIGGVPQDQAVTL